MAVISILNSGWWRAIFSRQSGATAMATVEEREDNFTILGREDRGSLLYAPEPEEMRRVFDRFDENHDGRICEADLGHFMKRLGFEMTDEDVRSMLQTIDRNSDNSVDFEEFLSMYRNWCGEGTSTASEINEGDDESALVGAFSLFDKNGDGYISSLELQQVLLNLGMREGRSLLKCQRMIERVDVDGNGQVDFKEFKILMCSDAFHL